MVKLTKEQKKQIKKTLNGGMLNFVLFKGVLYFGGFMFLFMSLFNFIIYGSEVFDESYIRFSLVIWGVAGLIFGFLMWCMINRTLKKV